MRAPEPDFASLSVIREMVRPEQHDKMDALAAHCDVAKGQLTLAERFATQPLDAQVAAAKEADAYHGFLTRLERSRDPAMAEAANRRRLELEQLWLERLELELDYP